MKTIHKSWVDLPLSTPLVTIEIDWIHDNGSYQKKPTPGYDAGWMVENFEARDQLGVPVFLTGQAYAKECSIGLSKLMKKLNLTKQETSAR